MEGREGATNEQAYDQVMATDESDHTDVGCVSLRDGNAFRDARVRGLGDAVRRDQH